MLRHMPRWTVTKLHKTTPPTDLVQDPEPKEKASEFERRWQEQSNARGSWNATFRRPKAQPPKTEP